VEFGLTRLAVWRRTKGLRMYVKRADGMAQVVELLPSKRPSTAKSQYCKKKKVCKLGELRFEGMKGVIDDEMWKD
jgi:hypothetical protein